MSLTEKTSFSMRSYSLIALYDSRCVVNFFFAYKVEENLD